MKKTYIAPLSTRYALEPATMLAGSLDGLGVQTDSNNSYEGGASLSNKRSNPIWDNNLLNN